MRTGDAWRLPAAYQRVNGDEYVDALRTTLGSSHDPDNHPVKDEPDPSTWNVSTTAADMCRLHRSRVDDWWRSYAYPVSVRWASRKPQWRRSHGTAGSNRTTSRPLGSERLGTTICHSKSGRKRWTIPMTCSPMVLTSRIVQSPLPRRSETRIHRAPAFVLDRSRWRVLRRRIYPAHPLGHGRLGRVRYASRATRGPRRSCSRV